MPTRNAEATWNGNLKEGNGQIKLGSGSLQVVASGNITEASGGAFTQTAANVSTFDIGAGGNGSLRPGVS